MSFAPGPWQPAGPGPQPGMQYQSNNGFFPAPGGMDSFNQGAMPVNNYSSFTPMGANVSQQVVQRGTAQYFSLAAQDKHQMSSRLPASNLPKVGKSAVPMALPYSSTGPDPLNYHAKDSVSAKQKAGVGILFSENTDPYTGRSQVVVKKIFPGGPAEATGLVKEGDMLTDVNGEDVVGKTLNELAETIPGPPETPISMGFMSKDTQQFYEVDMLRSMSGGPQVGQIKAVQPPGPVAPPDAPGSMNNRSVGPMAASVGPQSPPPQHEPVKQPPPLGEATVGFSFQRDESGSVKVANITFGSNAQQLGFEGDEILERIDNKSIEAWEDESIKYALSGPFSTLVQVQTNKRTVPVSRDCASYEPLPPPPPPQVRYIVQEQPRPIQYIQQAPPPPQPQQIVYESAQYIPEQYRSAAYANEPNFAAEPSYGTIVQPHGNRSAPMQQQGAYMQGFGGGPPSMNDGYY